MDRGTIEGLISIRGYVEALCLLLFLVSFIRFICRPVVPEGANPGVFGGFFSGAYNFVIKNSTIVAQGDDFVAKGMKALSEHSMKGAAYDSSLRDPPPHCHPGTRVQLVENIVTWFRKSRREKVLLWLNGPAGVGKSAVIQTVAESLAESNSVGATFFFSRLNNRNDPQRVFITIAFQLATRMPEYKAYVTKQIALDPSLLEKGMNDQFRIFVTEPFGKNRIGRENSPRVVLLDGLDECEGAAEQCRIVRLVSGFVLNFPDAPLVWAIASRPEPHLAGTFNDEAVASSCWPENMPVDSPQACRDVEHYLDASFKDMRKPFPHLPSNWPSETQFLKLSHGALGLFAFARTAVRFMEDLDHADPVSRLDLILTIIDRLDISVIDDHPFALLDALYTQILTPIPPLVWHNTKRILGFVICTQSGGTDDGLSYPLDPSNRTLMKASIILGLELSVVYASLHKLHSILDIPDSENASNSEVTFVHASFGDYLTNRARSKSFYIDRGGSVDDVTRCLFQLCLDNSWDTDWERSASKLPETIGLNFYTTLRKDAEHSLRYILTGQLRSLRGRGPFMSPQDRSDCLDVLRSLNPIEAWNAPGARDIIAFLTDLWNIFREELEGTGLFDEVVLRNLDVGHLDYRSNRPSFFPEGPKSEMLVRSSRVLRDYTQELRKCQRLQPEKQVIIYGSVPEERIAFFEGTYGYSDGYFCFQYPLVEPYRNPATSTGASPLPGAHNIVPVISAQGDSNTVVRGMKALSECVAEGATYDSSLRDPPPQCHPGTRVQLTEKVITWFRDNRREKALLWLNGPVGVGKSAVIQTVAESLAKSNSVGATLFFSRHHKDPQCVIITIAFQLAVRIPDYKTYITRRIALYPSLLEKGMNDQFQTFITEPFGNEGIGKGESPWAVLLDGLDECEGVDEQCRILRLVSEFILSFPDAPLVWVISSRPEPHITGTFSDGAVASSFWSEYIPVDSTEACQDVKHYLDASFKDMRKPFPHLPSDWPSETQTLKLSHGALGLFAFARTAVRFMEDLDHADPVSRLDLILTVIDRLDISVLEDHPFALLDALYTHILRSIPPPVWGNIKRILGFVICTQSGGIEDGLSYPLHSLSRDFMSVCHILGLDLDDMSRSFRELLPVLDVPDRERASFSEITFHHASFGGFLTDRVRSKHFYIDRGSSVDDITRSLFQLYLDKPWETESAPSTTSNIYNALRKVTEDGLHYAITGELRSGRGRGPFKSQPDRQECLDVLSRINPVEIYKLSSFTNRTILFLIELWNGFGGELESRGLFKEIQLQDLWIDHLDYETNIPAFISKERWMVHSLESLQKFTYELREHQRRHPKTSMIIYGSLPENRITFFKGVFGARDQGYFCFPYPY